MRKKHPAPVQVPGYPYSSRTIPMSAIRRYARQLGEKFHPQKIILFGSYAYGKPHPDSDVDLLVIMPCSNEVNQSIRMMLAIDPPFEVDLIVRTPKKLERRLVERNPFVEEITSRGKVLYEESDTADQRLGLP